MTSATRRDSHMSLLTGIVAVSSSPCYFFLPVTVRPLELRAD